MIHQIIQKNSLWNRCHIDKIFFLIVVILLIYGIFIMWSASNKNYLIMQQKIIQIIYSIMILLILAQVPPRIYERWAPYIYLCCLVLLILVSLVGEISKGAQRWLDFFGWIRFQPSEITKISVALVVAYCATRHQCPPPIKNIIIGLLLTAIPTILIIIQPDLGTAILTASSGLFVLFLSGMSWKLIIFMLFLIILFIPTFWIYFMHDYQKSRIIVLLHPETDPLGTGYHIIQSKIAIGSGGLIGKGWLQGTQSQLEFLPERHTDFVFAVIGEELGFLGILMLMLLYISLIFRGFFIAFHIPNMFGKLITGTFMLILFMCIFMNISMVSGILPIVGVPLPFISYGGSSLSVLMASFGIIMSIYGHKKMISKIL